MNFWLHRDSRRFTEIHGGLGFRLRRNDRRGLRVTGIGLALRPFDCAQGDIVRTITIIMLKIVGSTQEEVVMGCGFPPTRE